MISSDHVKKNFKTLKLILNVGSFQIPLTSFSENYFFKLITERYCFRLLSGKISVDDVLFNNKKIVFIIQLNVYNGTVSNRNICSL